MKPLSFTYPFCYTPHPDILAASARMISHIDSTPELSELFSEGKMLGVMMVETSYGETDFIYGFSGNVQARNRIDGFVPPIFDLLAPEGYFKTAETEISAISRTIAELRDKPGNEDKIKELSIQRRQMSVELQEWIFDRFIVSNADGERLSIAEVFARKGLVPPGGTGECAAPKMLQYAYDHGLKPLAMGEFWYGASPRRELRVSGSFYPSCTGKCGPLLEFMLKGLSVEDNPLQSPVSCNIDDIRIVFEDNFILVVDKESGMLSVPGRLASGKSIPELLEAVHGKLYPCHRLDMDTSGLIVYAKDEESMKNIERQFAERSVQKTYRATLIPGKSCHKVGEHGFIDLPLDKDWYDRPRQSINHSTGKHSVTEYQIISENASGELEVKFIPHTGRTHQLRVHSAHPEGLGRPIKGDRLYGGHNNCEDTPLQLKSDSITFTHPHTGQIVSFKI